MASKKKLWIGTLEAQPFRYWIPVFISEADRVSTLTRMGYDAEGFDRPMEGVVAIDHDKHGIPLISMTITLEAELPIWVHEIAHAVDYVFELAGVPPGAESTEVRAYLSDSLFTQLWKVMEKWYAKQNTPPPDIRLN